MKLPTDPDYDLSTAELVYKYREFDEYGYHVRLLSHNEAYFSSPSDFNDPFDCRLPIVLTTGSRSDQVLIVTEGITKVIPAISDDQARALAEEYVDNGFLDQDWDDVFFERFDQHVGVYSLAGRPDSLLMWSHYSDGHRGFCVGFDGPRLEAWMKTTQSGGLGIGGLSVSYVKARPSANLKDGIASIVLKSLETKSVDWSYEEEVRMIWFGVSRDRTEVIPHDAYACVILGSEIAEPNRDLVVSLVKKSKPHVKILQSVKSKDEYVVNLEPL